MAKVNSTYLTTQQCIDMFPIVYHDSDQPDKANKYLLMHEHIDRHNNNWNVEVIWPKYKGIITWNSLVYEKYKAGFNMIYCDQYMNMYVERIEDSGWIPWPERKQFLVAVYGPPASVDGIIMNARYDVPLFFHQKGFAVNGHGMIPDTSRPEFRHQWAELFRGPIPTKRKRDVLVQTKFCMAFENSREPYYSNGWVTEKIYDCLGCGSIPIYWGAPDIAERIPKEVFIDYRDFGSPTELLKYIEETPEGVFDRMSMDGLDFFDTVDFGEYLNVFRALL